MAKKRGETFLVALGVLAVLAGIVFVIFVLGFVGAVRARRAASMDAGLQPIAPATVTSPTPPPTSPVPQVVSVQSLEAAPAIGRVGVPMRVTATVLNAGPEDATMKVALRPEEPVTWESGGEPTAGALYITTSPVKAGDTTTVTGVFSPQRPGNWAMHVSVDGRPSSHDVKSFRMIIRP